MGQMSDTDGDARYHLPPVRDGKPEVLTVRRQERGDVVAVQGQRGGVQYRSLTLPMDFYVARGYISGEQYEAGERLYALWRGSIVTARFATMRFGDVSSGYDPEAIALAPRDYFRAMDAVCGFHRKRIIRQVCLFGEPAGEGRPMITLREGLDFLVRHFRT